jgi:rfaE bifunctional protein nucleotidyltransferase chain/domain
LNPATGWNVGSVLKREALGAELKALKDNGKKIVSTNGCFDILHVGHVRILQQSKALGDILVVGINSDASVRKLKGETRPINNEEDRGEVLAALECVDYVCVFGEDTPVEFLKVVQPNIHVKGSDYKPEDLEETPIVRSFGGDVKILPLVPNKSTTSVVAKIAADKACN